MSWYILYISSYCCITLITQLWADGGGPCRPPARPSWARQDWPCHVDWDLTHVVLHMKLCGHHCTTSPSSPTVLLRTNQTWWTALGQSSQHSIHNRITIRHSDTVNYCLATTVNSPVLCVKLVDNSSVLQ